MIYKATKHRCSTKAPHSPHVKSLHPKVELLKDQALSPANTVRKKLFVCVCVRVRLDLFNRSQTCTVSARRHSISLGLCPVQRSYQWYGILDLINPSYLHFEMHIAMAMLNTCCFVWFFFSFFQAIASTHEIWNGNTLHQDLVCQCFVQVGGWAGDLLPKALKLRIGVSFGYRFGIVFSPWPSRKIFCTYVSLQQPMPQKK